MLLFRLAFRNLRSNPRRTGLTLAAIALGLGVVLFSVNLQKGFYLGMVRAGVGSLAGHVVVQADGYAERPKPTVLVHDVGSVADILRRAYPQGTVAPRVLTRGLLQSARGSVGAAVTGFDPAAEVQVRDLHEQVVEGRWLGDDPGGILIGLDMARTLEVGLGDKLVFLGQVKGEVVSRVFRVRGLFHTGSARADGRAAFVQLAAAQELVGGGDVANMVTLHLDELEAADAAVGEVERRLGRQDLEVLHWRDAMPDLFGLVQLDRGMGNVMQIVLAVIVAFGVLNALTMSVLERTRQLGVMMALGTTPRQLAAMVLIEGSLLGLGGAFFGLLAGLAISLPLVVLGFDYALILGSQGMETGGILMDSVVHAAWDPPRMARYLVGAVLFCTCVAAWPAWRISRLRPVVALRDPRG